MNLYIWHALPAVGGLTVVAIAESVAAAIELVMVEYVKELRLAGYDSGRIFQSLDRVRASISKAPCTVLLSNSAAVIKPI